MAVIQFTVGDAGFPASGETNYFNSVLAGEKIKVFREGLYQYRIGVNRIIPTGTGTILFIPAFSPGERIRIQTI
jgi:hypothetical protein